MAIEDELKALAISTFGSMRAFSNAAGVPYTTLDSIFKRGVDNASIANIIKICSVLSISADALTEGKIASRNDISYSNDESELIRNYRAVNDEGKRHILATSRLVASNPSMQQGRQSAAAVVRQRVGAAEQSAEKTKAHA